MVVFDVCNDCNKHHEVRVTGGETESWIKGCKETGYKSQTAGPQLESDLPWLGLKRHGSASGQQGAPTT